MSLALDVVRDGLVVPHVDLNQLESYYEDLDRKFVLEPEEWEHRYWASGDQGRLTRAWKERNYANFGRGIERIRKALDSGLVFPVGFLHLAKIFGNNGDIQDFGLVSLAVVTDVGCQKLVAVMNTSDAATGINFKYHSLGTGTNAEAAGDTALQTELTTQYNPDNTRATGSQTTGSTTKVYRSVGTNTLDSGTPAVTEHGAQSASSGGSLLDRSVFSAINLVGANSDGIQATYDLTFTSGG